MRKVKIILFLLITCIFCANLSSLVMAEKRSIYIGDLIKLKITSQNITMDELKDKFKGFEIVDIKEDTDGFLITLRTFEPGEKVVQIGNKEIKIDVKSTLKEMKRDGIYEGNLMPETAGKSVKWIYVFFILVGVFLITGGINLWWFLKRKKNTPLSPFENFINQTKNLSAADSDYLVKLTSSFKKYIESSYSCTIRGKTSSEIIDEIITMPDLQAVLPDIQNWLFESDRFKFSGITVSTEKKQELSGLLLELVRKIDYAKEVKS
ncbi:MAG: hypothetical protein Q8942_16160 [Bacillota bacterium]|nr:hypothetical protein [Bacillota bacterium]